MLLVVGIMNDIRGRGDEDTSDRGGENTGDTRGNKVQ